jgi:hypothetical protein
LNVEINDKEFCTFHVCACFWAEQLHVKRALLFFKRHEKYFFESTLFLGLLRRVIPEKGSPAVAKLVPQHPFDAHGLSNCM